MRSHLPGEPAGTVRNIVIVGGAGFWSEYRFIASPGHSVSYPGIAEDFEHTFAALRALPCDVFLGAHGGYFDLLTKLQQYSQMGPQFVAASEEAFKTALVKQRAAAADGGVSASKKLMTHSSSKQLRTPTTRDAITRQRITAVAAKLVLAKGARG